jgi:hypothetical protein
VQDTIPHDDLCVGRRSEAPIEQHVVRAAGGIARGERDAQPAGRVGRCRDGDVGLRVRRGRRRRRRRARENRRAGQDRCACGDRCPGRRR